MRTCLVPAKHIIVRQRNYSWLDIFPMHDLFGNAVNSIQVGILDYQSDDPRRLISAARNYYAGLLLLGKQCLLEAAPNAEPMEVIGERFKPVPDGGGGVCYEPSGTRTIDLEGLKNRFEDFDLPWPKISIKRLQQLRNNLEHFYVDEPLNAVKEAIAQSFPMVISFFKTLNRDPAKELDEAWPEMLRDRDFFEAQRSECDQSLRAIQWPFRITTFENMSCPNCGSPLIEQIDPTNEEVQDVEGRCRGCGIALSAEKVTGLVLQAEFGLEAHVAAKEGDYDVIADCPACGEETYVTSARFCGCFWCCEEFVGECDCCHAPLRPNTVVEGCQNLCRGCYSDVMAD